MRKSFAGTAVLTLVGTIFFMVFYQMYGTGLYLTLAITLGTICYHFSMRMLMGYGVLLVARKPLNYHAWWFAPKAFEAPFYNLIKVKCWKNKMPTFYPETFSLQLHSEEEIIQTMCRSEIGHELMAAFSYLPLVMVIPFGEFWVFMITSMAASLFDMMFVIMQRYNRPRLVKLAERKKRNPAQHGGQSAENNGNQKRYQKRY